ncbi:MAG: hypothetical protein B6U87_03240 [Candidatus Aenigmarchaeota archaeon ex4484_52]|nr:MAG: hypothetical protein B6U87_03240 [Candidatus Aenigmarchaeota archaeon ex4484_52]
MIKKLIKLFISKSKKIKHKKKQKYEKINNAKLTDFLKPSKKQNLQLSDKLEKFKKLNTKYKFFAIFFCFIIISFFFSKTLFWICILTIGVSLSKIIQLFFPIVVGFDLGSFACIFISYYVNPILGLIFTAIGSIFGSILRGQHKIDMICLPILGYISIILFFYFIPNILFELEISFFIIAMIATLIYGFTNILFSYFFIGRIDINSFVFIITLIITNIYLINYLAPYLAEAIFVFNS